ncbi:MAG: D-aminoacyl-tRNA deacylase, partial [Haloquadratum sp.]
MIGLVASRADDASVAIASALRSLVAWESHEDADRSDADGGGTYHRRGDFELREFADWHLELSGVADAFSAPPRFVVFLSRHAGETGPLLTAHFTGNFGPAEYGGEPGDLARACPNVQRAVLESFDRHAPDGYDVGIECTHHGPTDVGAPSLFVELGSSESAWTDPAGARAVARAVLDLDGLRPDAADGGGGGDEPDGAVTDETVAEGTVTDETVADGDRNRLA